MVAEPMTDFLTPNALRQKGIDALARELGVIGMVRFIQLFDPGEGDYTAERDALLAGITMNDIERRLEKMKSAGASG